MIRLVVVFTGQFPLLRFFLLQQTIDGIKARFPESAMEIQPFFGRLQTCRGQSALMFTTLHFSTDQAGTLQYLHVLRHGRGTDVEWSGKFANGGVSLRQLRQYGPSGTVREGKKQLVELL